MKNDDKVQILKSRIINTINKLTIELISEENDKQKQMYLITCLNVLDTVVDEIEALEGKVL